MIGQARRGINVTRVLKEVIGLDLNQVGGHVPHILPIVDDAHHGIAIRKESFQVVRLAGGIEGLISGQNPGREVLSLGVQELGNLVRVLTLPKGADVQLVELGHALQELGSAGAQARVVPLGMRAAQLEVVDALDVVRHRVVGGVDHRMVEIDEQDQLPVGQQAAGVVVSELLGQLLGNFKIGHGVHHGHRGLRRLSILVLTQVGFTSTSSASLVSVLGHAPSRATGRRALLIGYVLHRLASVF